MTVAVASDGNVGDWLPLVKAAQELGVTRSAVYLMVTQHRLEGMQCGARWVVRRGDLEHFKASWVRPPNAGRRLPRAGAPTSGPDEVLALLREWGDAVVNELAEATGRHPGNIRKYLRLLEVRAQARRLRHGGWTATEHQM